MNTGGILTARNLQIWDNAVFAAHDDDPAKENLSPILNPQPKAKNSTNPSLNFSADNIDAEISDIETQIARLSKKLESLKSIKKAAAAAAAAARATPTAAPKRGRIVPAKFLNNLETPSKKTTQDPSSLSLSRSRSRSRGLSLGPAEIHHSATPVRTSLKPAGVPKLESIKEKVTPAAAWRRGSSLGPAEILRQASRTQEIAREKGTSFGLKETKRTAARSLSTSPKSRKPANSRVSEARKGAATVGVKKSVRLDEESVSGVKPRALFPEKKRPLKNGRVRVVASRYSLASGGEGANKRRKWSLPETEKEESAAEKGKRSLSLGGANVVQSKEEERTPASIMKIAEGLPRIRNLRCWVESPRDSGRAKRVAEMDGRGLWFAEEEEDDGASSPCQKLSFEDGESSGEWEN